MRPLHTRDSTRVPWLCWQTQSTTSRLEPSAHQWQRRRCLQRSRLAAEGNPVQPHLTPRILVTANSPQFQISDYEWLLGGLLEVQALGEARS